jgi:hypothetical protein
MVTTKFMVRVDSSSSDYRVLHYHYFTIVDPYIMIMRYTQITNVLKHAIVIQPHLIHSVAVV